MKGLIKICTYGYPFIQAINISNLTCIITIPIYDLHMHTKDSQSLMVKVFLYKPSLYCTRTRGIKIKIGFGTKKSFFTA